MTRATNINLRRARPVLADGRVVWLGAALLLLGGLLPWVSLKANRLAPGQALHPWPALEVGLLAVAVLLTLLARRPAWATVAATAALLGGLAALGALCAGTLAGALPIARAGASGGFWLWMTGAAVALSGAAAGLGARQRALAWLWLPGLLVLLLTGSLNAWSVLVEGRAEGPRLLQEFGTHVTLVLVGLGLALVIGAPLAVWAAGRARVAGVVLGLANGVQTIPSLAMLGLMIAPLAALGAAVPWLRAVGVKGIGTAPALVALTLYALLPVLRNGVVALRAVSPGVLDAARGMGMTESQRFWRVALPLALPVWLSGVRQAFVLLVGVTSVAALIGAGGLGVYIFRGLQNATPDLILLGALPACALALTGDGLLRALEGALNRRYGTGERP